MKTSIIIVTYNNIEYTKLCIDSIKKYTNKEDYDLIIVDNNSSDETAKWVKSLGNINLIENKENLGFPRACNQGIELIKDNDVLLLNNDVIVTSNWLNNLKKCLYSNRTIGAVGAITNSCSNFQSIDAFYDVENLQCFARSLNVSNEIMWEERLRLVGFCMMIKREVINSIGLLDEIFSPGNFEDDDYSLRIRKAGYRLMLCKDVYIHHFGSISFGKEMFNFQKIIERNSQKFYEKWNINYSQMLTLNLGINDYIDREKDEKFSFLEVGSNGGGNLIQIKNKYKNADLYGVEENDSIIINLNHIGIIYHDIYEIIEDKIQVKFDYIFLKEPTLTMNLEKINKLKNNLNQRGKIIVISDGTNDDIYKRDIIKNLLLEFKGVLCKEINQSSNKAFILECTI